MRRRAVSQERLERSTVSSSSHIDDDDRSSFVAKTMPTPRMTPRNKQVQFLYGSYNKHQQYSKIFYKSKGIVAWEF
jgi:uncharacterized protein YxeA